MLIHNRFSRETVSAILMLSTLAACGGGGSSGAALAPVSPVVPTLVYSALVSNVATPVYAATANTTLSNLLSATRQAANAGLLAQGNALDVAAANHANFLINNSLLSNGTYLTAPQGASQVPGGHYEDATLPGYTGANPQQRATAAGYSGTVSELLSFGSASAADCLRSLENSVYHLAQLISPFVDTGLEFNDGNGSGSLCVIELGFSNLTLGQLPASGSLVSYPSAGISAVPPTFYNHAESPLPAADLNTTGHPVVVLLYSLGAPTLVGSDVQIHTFHMADATGAPVAARLLSYSGVTSTGPALTVDSHLAGAGDVVLLPLAPLSADTTYRMTFSATVKGIAVSSSWSFTTGAAN